MSVPKAPKAPKAKKAVSKPLEANTPKTVKMPRKTASTKPGQKQDSVEESIKALFTQIAGKMDSFETVTGEGGQKPFDFVGVISLLDQVLALDPANREALNYKGMMYVGTCDNDKAIKCFDQVLAINPADVEGLNNKGIALYGMGKDKEALKYIDKAIQLNNRYSDALMNKAVILHGMGRDEEAESLMAKARALYTING